MGVSPKEIEHIASLARLRLTPKERKKFSDQLSSIFKYVKKINELELAKQKGSLPEKGKKETSPIDQCRLDQIEEFADQENLIKQAPAVKDNLIQTKPVFK